MVIVTLRTLLDSDGRVRVVMTRVPGTGEIRVLSIHATVREAWDSIQGRVRVVKKELPGIVESVRACLLNRRGRVYGSFELELDIAPDQVVRV